jgi:glutamate racemase
MQEEYILFLDSGMGGLSILNHFYNVKKYANYIYYADTYNFPYGKKDELTIGKILYNIFLNINSAYKISLITIVCNTASVSALKYLRERIDVPIIGTVPAIKPASQITKNNRIGILATETTAKTDYLNNLVNQFAHDKEVFIQASAQLADAVEFGYSENKIKSILKNDLKVFKDNDIDTLVLGCTHYSFLTKYFNEYFSNKVNLLDSKEGVTKRILSFLPKLNISDSNKHILYLSKSDSGIYERYCNFNKNYKLFDSIKCEELSCRKA